MDLNWEVVSLDMTYTFWFVFSSPSLFLILSAVQNQVIKKCNKGKEFCSLQQELPDL